MSHCTHSVRVESVFLAGEYLVFVDLASTTLSGVACSSLPGVRGDDLTGGDG